MAFLKSKGLKDLLRRYFMIQRRNLSSRRHKNGSSQLKVKALSWWLCDPHFLKVKGRNGDQTAGLCDSSRLPEKYD